MRERDCRVTGCIDGECRRCKRVRALRRENDLQIHASERERRLARAREREAHILGTCAEKGYLPELIVQAEALVTLGLCRELVEWL